MHLRKWLAALLMVAMTLGLVGQVAFAAGEDPTIDGAVQYLQRYGIVQGDSQGLRLMDPITRAEMTKVLVVATGRERDAAVLQGAPAFKDTASHWASGFIAVAKNLGLAGGFPDGTFQPNKNVTNAEVVAFLIRAAGVQPDASQPWPRNVLVPAAAAGIIPPGLDMTVIANTPASRGAVFLLAHRAFLLVKGADGKNLYQRVFDSEPPALSLDQTAASTTAASVTISGTAAGAAQVTVAGQPVALGADGGFSTTVALAYGANEIKVEAMDDLGNVAAQTVSISRSAGTAARIEAPASVSLKTGEVKVLDIKVLDDNGIEIPNAELTAEISGDIGTFDPDTLTFTAGGTTGAGTVTLRSGSATAQVRISVGVGAVAKVELTADRDSAAIGESVQITAKAYDAYGNEIPGLPALYTVTGGNALINPSTGTFIGAAVGVYTVTGTIGTTTGSITIGVYGDQTDIKLSGPETVVGNGQATKFTVAAVDQNGSTVRNVTGTVELETTTGELVDESGRSITSVNLKDGVGTFYVKTDELDWGSVGTITAEDSEDSDMADEIKFEVVEQEAAAIVIKSQDNYLAANQSGSDALIKVMVVDQSGAEMLDGAWDIEWSISGPARERESNERSGTFVYSGGDGGYDFYVESLAGDLGTVTVEFEANDLEGATAKLQATVVSDPAQVKISFDRDSQKASDVADESEDGYPVTAMVTVADRNGVPVKWTGTVTVDFSADYADAMDEDGDINEVDDRRIQVSFDEESRKSFQVAFEKAGTVTATASAGGELSSSSASVRITPGPVAGAGFTVSKTFLSVASPEGTATVQLYDDFGNPVAQEGVRVKVEGNNSTMKINGRGDDVTVTTDANGQAVLRYSVRPDIDFTYTLTVVDGGDVDAYSGKSQLDISVKSTVADQIEITFNVDGEENKVSGEAGALVTIRAAVKDKWGTPLDGYEDLLKLEVEDGAFSVDDDGVGDTAEDLAADSDWTWNSGDEVYQVNVIAAKAMSSTVKVSVDAGGQTVTGTGRFRVRAGTADHVIIQEADFSQTVPTITVTKGDIRRFTLRVTDEWNNPVSANPAMNVVFDEGGTDAIFRTEATGADIGSEGVTLTSATAVYILVPKDGSSGEAIINADGTQWTFYIEAKD